MLDKFLVLFYNNNINVEYERMIVVKELYEIPEFKLSVFNIEDIVTAGVSTGDIDSGNTEGGDVDDDFS